MSLHPVFCLISICLVGFSVPVMSKIKHISLHEVESTGKKYFSVKLNIVEQERGKLKFTITYKNTEKPLKYQRINDYMLRLKSSNDIQDGARINIYELEKQAWLKVKTIKILSSPPLNVTDKKIKSKPKQNLNITQKSTQTVTHNTSNCQLAKQPNETLWSIASRYKEHWNIDIYSAMIAIYKSNLSQFNKQNIAGLSDGATLICPTADIMATLVNKKAMHDEFIRLNNL